MDQAQLISGLLTALSALALVWFILYTGRKGLEEGKRIWRTLKTAAEYIDEPNDPAVMTADMFVEWLTGKEFDEALIVGLGVELGRLADKMKGVVQPEAASASPPVGELRQ